MKNKLNFHLMSVLVVLFVLPSLGCQSDKLALPKFPTPKLAFWKKDTDRIESQPDNELMAPSQQLNPESPDGSSNRMAQRSNNELPGNYYPEREPYKMPEIYEDPEMKNNYPNTSSGGGGQKSMVANPYANNSGMGGTQVDNQYSQNNNTYPNTNMGGGPSNSNGGFQNQSFNPGSSNTGNSSTQVISNPYVGNNGSSGQSNNNSGQFNGGSNTNYPTTGVQGYENQPPTQNQQNFNNNINQFQGNTGNNLPAETPSNVPPEFKLSQPATPSTANQLPTNTPQFENVQTGTMPAVPQTAALPPELMNTSGYQPGSTKLKPKFQKTSFESSPMPTQPAQEFQPEISPAGGGSFVPNRP